MARIQYIAGVDLRVGGKIRPAGSEVPEAAKWKNLGAYVRTRQIVLRGPGAEDAEKAYKREQPIGRPLNPSLLAEALAKGEHADADLERPILDPDDDSGEEMEREGKTVDDIAEELVEEAIEEAELAEEAEAVLDPETPRRRGRGRGSAK